MGCFIKYKLKHLKEEKNYLKDSQISRMTKKMKIRKVYLFRSYSGDESGSKISEGELNLCEEGYEGGTKKIKGQIK